MHHAMKVDPRRRFIFGATIENTNMRLWVFHRSHGMVTEAFNFVTVSQSFDPSILLPYSLRQEHEKLIKLVLSFSHATEEELGYDRTFRLVGNVDGVAQYEIDVGERTFLTLKTLSDIAADRLCGRATRVFKVYEKSNPTRMLALKDQWIDDDREEEAVILDLLHAQIREAHAKKTFEDMNLPKHPWEYFLTVNVHSRVKVGSEDDNTKETIMRGHSLSNTCPLISLVIDKTIVGPATVVESTGHIPYPNTSIALVFPERVPHLTPRRHQRIVFNELGEALHDLDSLADFFRSLADATLGKLKISPLVLYRLKFILFTALEIIHRMEHVHRDISTGNILFYQGGGLLSDLEFLKKMSSLETHEVKTVRTLLVLSLWRAA
jgi:hypothetical protein